MFKKVYSGYSAFCTQPSFYSPSAVCILHSVCSLPLVRSLRFTPTESFTDINFLFVACSLFSVMIEMTTMFIMLLLSGNDVISLELIFESLQL